MHDLAFIVAAYIALIVIGMAVEMGLARVTNAVKTRYPAAFQTLH